MCISIKYNNEITNANLKAVYGYIPNGVEEKNLYFYHPDHLGSSSYITDREGQVIQHTEYMAFGETFVDEHSVSNRQPYLFNGKELDFETGLYYYGARYYDPKVSIFLNVDPLVEKTMTSYAYVNNNPINLIDPTGMEAEGIDPSDFNKNADNRNKLAMREFLNTKEGYSFFAKYAKKGDVLGGVTFSEDGIYHKKGIDIKIGTNINLSVASGEVNYTQDKGKLVFNLNITNGSRYIGNSMETIAHEVFVHILPRTKDYIDNKKFDFSAGFDKEAIDFLKANYKDIDGNLDTVG